MLRGVVRPLNRGGLAVDAAIAFGFVVVCIAPWGWDLEQASTTSIALTASALAVRRLSPPFALVLVWAAALQQMAVNERPSLVLLSVVVVLGTVAAVGTRAELVLSGLSAVFGGVLGTLYLARTGTRYTQLLNSGSESQNIVVALLPTAALLASWLVGVAMRSIRSTSLEAGRREAAEDTAVRALDEAQAERIRSEMARDVHDVVGHSLAVIIAQADSVRFVEDEARLRGIVDTIARTARGSLTEVRAVLETTQRATGEIEPPALAELIDQLVGSGVNVERTLRGTRRELAGGTGLLARRVLQEMVTNALRHGVPGGTIRVVETWRSRDLVLEVENRVGPVASPGTGLGLSGMRTRLAAVGGDVEAEAVDGVFTARARIPDEVGA